MDQHVRILHHLISYLKNRGVPDSAIAVEWGNRQKYVVDLAIMAKEYDTPTAIFEIKSFKSAESVNRGIKSLKKAVNALNITVPCYLVFGYQAKNDVEIFDVTGAVYNGEEIPFKNFSDPNFRCDIINFDEMQLGIESKNRENIRIKRDEKQEKLERFCYWIIPLYCVVLILLDCVGLYKITYERLWVHGAILVVTMLPFFKEVSFGSFIVKRNDLEDKQK